MRLQGLTAAKIRKAAEPASDSEQDILRRAALILADLLEADVATIERIMSNLDGNPFHISREQIGAVLCALGNIDQ